MLSFCSWRDKKSFFGSYQSRFARLFRNFMMVKSSFCLFFFLGNFIVFKDWSSSDKLVVLIYSRLRININWSQTFFQFDHMFMRNSVHSHFLFPLLGTFKFSWWLNLASSRFCWVKILLKWQKNRRFICFSVSLLLEGDKLTEKRHKKSPKFNYIPPKKVFFILPHEMRV